MIKISRKARVAVGPAGVIRLSHAQMFVMAQLAERPGEIIPRDSLIPPAIWGRPEPVRRRAQFRVLMHSLREKATEIGVMIEVIPGEGVRLVIQ